MILVERDGELDRPAVAERFLALEHGDCRDAIGRAMTTSEAELAAMRGACRARIADFSLEAVAERMLAAIGFARTRRVSPD